MNNIVILDDKISFIDYGLAEINNINNENNCKNFITLLNILNNKFKNIEDITERHVSYHNFMNTIRSNKMYINNVF